MKTIELSTSNQSLASCAGESENGIIILTMHEQPVAAIVPLTNADVTWKQGLDAEFVAIIERARAEIRAGKSHSLADIKREFGLA